METIDFDGTSLIVQSYESIVELDTIIVSVLPPDTSKFVVKMFFENPDYSGGGKIKHLDVDGVKQEAKITFEEPEGIEPLFQYS